MALLFCDGFGHVDDGYEYLKWDYSNGLGDIMYGAGYGRHGDWGVHLQKDYYMERAITLSDDTIIIGTAMYVSAFDPENWPIKILDGATTQITLQVDTGGYIKVKRNATLIGASAAGVITSTEWFYLEIKVKFHTTVGTVDIRVNGVNVLSLTDVNTDESDSASCTTLRIAGGYDNVGSTLFDDLYVCNTLGAVNNDFLGDVRIATLYPTSDGNSSDFTPSTGTDHYALVDEPQLVGDTDHNESGTVGHKDLYGMTTYDGSDTILGVQVVAAVKNTDAGTMAVRPLSRSGATPADNEGDDFILSQTMKGAMQIWEQEPTDTVAWDASKINAAEFGLKIQS